MGQHIFGLDVQIDLGSSRGPGLYVASGRRAPYYVTFDGLVIGIYSSRDEALPHYAKLIAA